MLRIKFERLRRGWSQTVLAYHATMSVADVSRIESGRLRPYPSQLEKLATALSVQPDALLKDVPAEEAAAALDREPDERRATPTAAGVV